MDWNLHWAEFVVQSVLDHLTAFGLYSLQTQELALGVLANRMAIILHFSGRLGGRRRRMIFKDNLLYIVLS